MERAVFLELEIGLVHIDCDIFDEVEKTALSVLTAIDLSHKVRDGIVYGKPRICRKLRGLFVLIASDESKRTTTKGEKSNYYCGYFDKILFHFLIPLNSLSACSRLSPQSTPR